VIRPILARTRTDGEVDLPRGHPGRPPGGPAGRRWAMTWPQPNAATWLACAV